MEVDFHDNSDPLLIQCPLKDMAIKEYECYEISMAAEGLAPRSYLSNNKEEIQVLKEICLNCNKHRYD